MSAIDKLDASLLKLTRYVSTLSADHIAYLIEFADVSRAMELVRAELAAPILPESYPDPGEKTLRDEFAMHALAAMIGADKEDINRGSKGVPIFAAYAYEWADAMLAARKPPP